MWWRLVESYLKRAERAVWFLKLVNVLSGVALAISYFSRGSEKLPEYFSGSLFVIGIVCLVVASVLLMIFEHGPVEQLRALHEAEAARDDLASQCDEADNGIKTLNAWLTLIMLLQEVVDKAISAATIDEETKTRLYDMAVEFIAEPKGRLFGVGDEYVNISVYEYKSEDGLLHCVACYRSRSSDAKGPHRAWKPGSGHVGKAFELKSELVCSDATQPDVAAWITAPPDSYHPSDDTKYRSLVSVPIALDQDAPMGVLVMTSDVPGRFQRNHESYRTDEPNGRVAVYALQDIAAQLAQLMHLIQTKESNVGSNQ